MYIYCWVCQRFRRIVTIVQSAIYFIINWRKSVEIHWPSISRCGLCVIKMRQETATTWIRFHGSIDDFKNLDYKNERRAQNPYTV